MMVFVCSACIVTSLPASLHNLLTLLFGNQLPFLKALDQSGSYKWFNWIYHVRLVRWFNCISLLLLGTVVRVPLTKSLHSPAINPMIYISFNSHLLTELKYLLRCKSR